MPSPTERTLVLVKPDGVRRGLIGEVLSRVESKGLRLVALELRTLDRETAETHYAEHVDRPFFAELVEFITCGPLVARSSRGPTRSRRSGSSPAPPTRSRRRPARSAATTRSRCRTSSTARTRSESAAPRDRALLPEPVSRRALLLSRRWPVRPRD